VSAQGGDVPALLPVAFTPLQTPGELMAQAKVPESDVEASRDAEALCALARYVAEFLTAGHPDLGRPGAVCPFAAGAMKSGLLQITSCDLDKVDEEALTFAIDQFRGMFRPLSAESQKNKDEIYRSVVIVFPRLPTDTGPALIEQVQKKLKPAFVQQNLMIGEFYPDCPAPGIHNAEFRPLRTPVTSIAIRRITLFDAPFMLDDAQCLASYQNRFGEAGRIRIQKLLDARAINVPV